MKLFALLLFVLSATHVGAQDLGLGTLTVGDIQKMYEVETDKELTKNSFQIFFGAYMVGYSHGFSQTVVDAGIVDEDVSPKFAECAPNSERLFYEMLGVTDSRAELNVAQFAAKAMRDSCRSTANAIVRIPDPS